MFATLVRHIVDALLHRIRYLRSWLSVASLAPRSAFISPSARFVGKGFRIGEKTRIEDHVFMRCGVHGSNEFIEIGAGCRIWHGVEMHSWGGHIRIGNKSSLNPYCVLYGHGGLDVGNHVRIATHVVIVASNHRIDASDKLITEQGVSAKGIVIEDDVWIGAGATILDGVRVGRGAVIAAGAVVTRNVPDNAVVAGVPAQELRLRGSN